MELETGGGVLYSRRPLRGAEDQTHISLVDAALIGARPTTTQREVPVVSVHL